MVSVHLELRNTWNALIEHGQRIFNGNTDLEEIFALAIMVVNKRFDGKLIVATTNKKTSAYIDHKKKLVISTYIKHANIIEQHMFINHVIAHELAHAMSPTYDHGPVFMFFMMSIIKCQQLAGLYPNYFSNDLEYGGETVSMHDLNSVLKNKTFAKFAMVNPTNLRRDIIHNIKRTWLKWIPQYIPIEWNV